MERSEEVKVGLFVMGAAVLLVLALVLVGGLNLFQQPRHTYTVRTHFAGGMEEGAPLPHTRARMDQILTDGPPRVKSVLANFESSSGKIDKFMDEIKVTRQNLDELLKTWSSLSGGDQAEVQLTLQKLRDTLVRGEQAME